MTKLNRRLLIDSLRTQLWPIPLIAVAVAAVLGQVVPFIDGLLDDDVSVSLSGLLFGGGPEAARSLLETIASSMITVTSLTFSLTVVTLQLASSQFSPRLLRTFTRDRFVHNTLALFLATFVFALTVLRSIRVETSAGPGFVPEIAVTAAFVLAIASVVGLVLFLAHLSRQIRVETMLRDVHREVDQTLDQVFPTRDAEKIAEPPSERPGLPISARSSGFLIRIDPKTAVAAATTAEAFVVVDAVPGRSVITGTPVARVWTMNGTALEDKRLEELDEGLIRAFRTGFERTSTQDAGFGLQQLLDVTNKALSPAVNDPTTAVHALSHISAVLCSLVGRTTGPRTFSDSAGIERVTLTFPTFAQLLELVMDQLLAYAFVDPRTAQRTLVMLREIAMTSARTREAPASRTALQTQVRRVRDAIKTSPLGSDILTRLNDDLLAVTNELRA